MSVIDGICSAVKEDKVNEWLKDNYRKVEISALGNEFAEAAAKVYPDQQKLMNTSMSDIDKGKK